jgi:hypothetical protein
MFMRVRVKRLMKNLEVGVCHPALSLFLEPGFFGDGLSALGRITQLIALTGKGGGWRKTIMDRSIAYVRPSLIFPIPDPIPTSIILRFQPLRWTAKKGPWPTGDPDLQHYVGELLYKGANSPSNPEILDA